MFITELQINPTRTVRTITVSVRRPSLTASPYIYPPVPHPSLPHSLSLSRPLQMPSLSSSTHIITHAKSHNLCPTGIPLRCYDSRTKNDESAEETKQTYNFDLENSNNSFSTINGKNYYHSFLDNENKRVKYESL